MWLSDPTHAIIFIIVGIIIVYFVKEIFINHFFKNSPFLEIIHSKKKQYLI